MPRRPIYVGDAPFNTPEDPPFGHFVKHDGESWYKITNYDRMPPFFITVVSDSDHWMFLSSNGALTAGRKGPEHALFPYTTDDKIHDAQDQTGSKTILLAHDAEKTYLWEPFSMRHDGIYDLQRNLYKSAFGNKIRFEEINADLGLTFAYTWCNSDRFGFVKHAQLGNQGCGRVRVEVLDGIQNMLPYGVERAMQNERSTLLDAYKKNELLADSGLGLFLMSSIPVDKPEPSEALKATTVCATGLHPKTYLLSTRQLDLFRQGASLTMETDVRAERGAFFIHDDLQFSARGKQDWYLVAEINQGPDDVVALVEKQKDKAAFKAMLKQDIEAGTDRLKRIVASADGLQCTADQMTTARHFANVLFNVMRGGIFDDQVNVGREDLFAFIQHYNRPVASAHTGFFQNLPERLAITNLLVQANRQEDPQLVRLCYEYLPLTFSRRHGDPSRPWNNFTIDTRNEDGSKKLSFEGNWRDIFQNWEALGRSYPDFLESMISKFVNASTVDGYNPYRITRGGIDWEVIDPADPWSYIGYWGDHQIIYLLKLLELSQTHHPDRLIQLLEQDIFSYANVPYRITAYHNLLKDPHNTISFDTDGEDRIAERVAAIGADGKLVWDRKEGVYLVNLTEKLLVTVLSKLSNFIPEGGIWMNTQRPEWNDANNALVGYGVSMVTLCYLRRFLKFGANLFGRMALTEIALSEEIAKLFEDVFTALCAYSPLLQGTLTDQDRRKVLDALGEAGSNYRCRVYEEGFSGQKTFVSNAEVQAFFEEALAYMDHSIRANQRPDKLFHAYNLMSVEEEGGIAIHPMYEMLEGQVAVLSAGVLSGVESLEVLHALRSSTLYRPDQDSYLLYPNRTLPRYTEKNAISPEGVSQSVLLQMLVENGDQRLILQDQRGACHFNGAFRNRGSVNDALDILQQDGYSEAVGQDRAYVLELFESVFNHRSYTGRSGVFFGYEGLGSIYWHMVSKLVLAVQETYTRARAEGAKDVVLDALADVYFEVQAGIGLGKSPALYGAFPMDPYSHTPGNAGAQQPGMTGQVKEDILSRWGELGVTVQEGQIQFQVPLLRASEFLAQPSTFSYFDVAGNPQSIILKKGELAFTYCQVPVVYHLSTSPKIILHYVEDSKQTILGDTLDLSNAARIFSRQGEIQRIEVDVLAFRE